MTSDDPKLRSIYRNASRETSPEHADRAIMALAKRKPEQYWQPFALAATVLLSFAFLVNIGLLQPEVATDVPASATEDKFNAYQGEEMPAPVRQKPAAERSSPAREPELPAVRSFAPESQAASENRDDAADLARVLEDLKENNQISVEASASSVASKRSADGPQPRYCSEAASASAGSWYRCVLELRDEGFDDQADFEQALLLTRFPDFEIR